VVALSYAEYLNGYVADVAVDGAGNTYVTGQNSSSNGFYVTEYSASGVQVYSTNIGTSTIYPQRVRVDASGNVYVAGWLYSSATLPTGANSYQSTQTANTNGFLVQIAAGGGTVPYATYIGGTDTFTSAVYGLGVQTIGGVNYVYVAGYTYSSTFPTTPGVYQTAFSGTPGSNYDGWVAQFKPAASGGASLIYSTFLGTPNTQFYGLAVDSSGNTYVTGNTTSSTFPVTSGAFAYHGYYSSSGGAYVTKLNPKGTALVYSAYLGYGNAQSIAVDSSSNAYVTGQVQSEDFPSTSGAYQTTYPGGFVSVLNAAGSAEVYSTFLGGPSSISETNVLPFGIALESGCTSPCNAYVSGWTSTSDFPAINAIQGAESTSGNSAFVVELAANGASALVSTYLSGLSGYVYNANDSPAFGFAPAIAVDISGNMSVVGDLYGAADFPVTLANSNPDGAFLARITSAATLPFTWSTPTAVTFNSQPVGVSTTINGGTQTVTVRNLSDAAVAISSIEVSPASLFSATDSCAGTIPAGGVCALSLDFDPGSAGTRAGTVTVSSNASNSPIVVALTGIGVDTAYTETSVGSLTFANQNVGTSSAPLLVTLTNVGDVSQTFNFSSYSQYLGADFSATNDCPSELSPGLSCVAAVTFSPTQAGLRTGTLFASSNGGPNISIPLSGTGLAGGATGIFALSATSLTFGTQTVGETVTPYYFNPAIYLENNGTVPITVNSIAASGDFSIAYNSCAPPLELDPLDVCSIYVAFTPSTTGTRTGNLTVTDTAAGSPQSVALSGTGVAAVQTLEFYPSSGANFGNDTPVGVQSAAITVYPQNVGTSPITFDRVLVTGDFGVSYDGCSGATVPGSTQDGTGSSPYCQVNVYFQPTATGLRTGTLTFIDSAGNSPQTVTLSGNAIADTGTVLLDPNALSFGTEAVGATSAVQYVNITNPGDSPITINSYATGTGSFSVANYTCAALPFPINPGGSCTVQLQFTPASAAALTDKLTVTGSVATTTVSLAGTGVAASETIAFTPASPMNSGSVVVGQSSGANGESGSEPGDLISIRNTGTAPVTFSAVPAIGGTNEADFAVYNPYNCGGNGTQLQPGTSCPMWISFTPSVAKAETATFTFTDDAPGGTQVMTLDGTGIAAAPKYYLSNNLINFDNQVEGTTSPENTFIYFYNNSGAAVTLGNVVLPAAGFVIPGGAQSCSGATVANGSSCYAYVEFAPTSAGLITGSITFKNSAATTLVSATMTGYSPADAPLAFVTPTALDFTTSQVVNSTSSYQTTTLTNTGNVPLTVGTVTGTNLGAPPTDEFSLYSDGCSTVTVNAGGTCTVYVEFTPKATGARTGSLTIPVTYTGGKTASFPVTLSGTGTAEVNSAVLTPGNGSFIDQTVGVQSSYTVTLYLADRGNQPFNVGTVTGVNTIVGISTKGEFSVSPDQCSGQSVAANTGTCAMYIYFTPSATGARTGSISFPVTFADGTKTTVTATLSGIGVAAAPKLQFNPSSLEFQPEIENNTSGQVQIAVKNIGNEAVSFASISTLSAGFVLGANGDGCSSAGTLGPAGTCYIYVSFAPTTTGNITGTLTVNDNSTGGPHKLALSGTGILASQQIAVSQTALTFPSQPQGSTSSPQVIDVINQSDSTVTSIAAALSGTNAADYTLTNNCPASLGARTGCTLTVTFNPAATGTRTALITLTGSDTGSPHKITLTGTAVAAGPAAAITPPSPLTFPKIDVGSFSNTEFFSVTNTGTGNLNVSGVALSGKDVGDYSIVSDGCSGASLTQSQNCIVGVRFTPADGGPRSAIASVTDNAPGSPQTITVSALGHGYPGATLSTATLDYANTYIGSTTASQTVTLTNSGTDTLKIISIALTGPNTTDFTALVTTCPASIAPGASCTISTAFAPTAVGSRTAAITITDNAQNIAAATQTVIVTGTGLGVPTASLSTEGPLTFASTFFGTTNPTAQTVTVTNTGTAALNVTSVGFAGADPADFAETNNCGNIAPSGTCAISVKFTPTAVGTRTATLQITDNSGNVTGTTQSVTVTGPATADVSVSPATIAFGSISFGTTKTVDVTVSNVGTIPSLTVSAASSGSSVIVLTTGNTCGAGVAPGKSCTLPLEFNAAVLGAETNSVTITTNGGANPVVTTTGTATTDVSISATSLAFGTITHGTTKTLDLTITNVGTLPMLTISTAISGANPADFAVLTTGNTCTGGVAAGASCTLPVEFAPAAAAAYTATLTVTTNGGTNPVVTLTGTGD
jgi:hypothetical protein